MTDFKHLNRKHIYMKNVEIEVNMINIINLINITKSVVRTAKPIKERERESNRWMNQNQRVGFDDWCFGVSLYR